MRRSLLAALVVVLVLVVVAPAHAGVNGEFFFPCPFSHSAMDDPIVFPGLPGASHMHDFFGNNSTDAFSTASSLSAATTGCRVAKDKSGYWVPELYRYGAPVMPVKIQAYYRNETLVAPQPFPFGFKLVQGDSHATAPQYDWTHREFWSCDAGPHLSSPPNCPTGTFLIMNIRFPQCWDGVNLDSADHRSHMAYVNGQGLCPSDHPVVLPLLLLEVKYNIHDGASGGFTLASGSIYSVHGDFFNAWDPPTLANLITTCIDAGVSCHL
jgi:Domain of unknown function (DUF1996)